MCFYNSRLPTASCHSHQENDLKHFSKSFESMKDLANQEGQGYLVVLSFRDCLDSRVDLVVLEDQQGGQEDHVDRGGLGDHHHLEGRLVLAYQGQQVGHHQEDRQEDQKGGREQCHYVVSRRGT